MSFDNLSMGTLAALPTGDNAKRSPQLLTTGGRPTKFTPERLQQIRNLVERGESRERTAEILDVTVGSLQVTCSRLGISLRRPGVGETKASSRTPHTGLNSGDIFVLKSKLLQSAKLREIRAALEADGFIGLDAQAKALGLSRSTAWTILNGSHKSSGLSAKILNRMLAAPLLGKCARAKILEYIAEKKAGHYGSSKSSLRKFDQRLAA
jgi:hypothetical protein